MPAIVSDEQDAIVKDLRKRHDITTNKGVVSFLNAAINAFVNVPEEVERQDLNTLGYVCGIQLKAIAAVQAEDRPSDSIQDLLGANGSIEIRMTKEERKMFLTAGSPDKMAQVLQAVKNDGRVVELEAQADGSYSIPALEAPPRTDAPMPITELRGALVAEGVDIRRDEVVELFGGSLGTDSGGEIETFGFDAMFAVEPKTTAALGHTFEPYSLENPDMPGVLIRRHRCTKCGISTNSTAKHANETCEVFG